MKDESQRVLPMVLGNDRQGLEQLRTGDCLKDKGSSGYETRGTNGSGTWGGGCAYVFVVSAADDDTR